VAGSMRLGQGGRSAKLARQLRARKGKGKPRDVGALVGWIGRRKYGAKRMAKWSAAGRKKSFDPVAENLSSCDAILKGALGTFGRRVARAAYTVATLGETPEETTYSRKFEGKKPRKLESALSEPGQEWPEHDPGLWKRKSKVAKALAGVDADLSACDRILKRLAWTSDNIPTASTGHGYYSVMPSSGGFRARYTAKTGTMLATSHIVGTGRSRKEAMRMAEDHDDNVNKLAPRFSSAFGKALDGLDACDRILKQFGTGGGGMGSVIPQGADRGGVIPQGGDRGGPTGLGRSLFSTSRSSGNYSVTGGGSFIVHFKAKGGGWKKLSHHSSLKEAKDAIDKHGGGSHLVQAKGSDAATPFGTRGGANWRL